MLRKIFNHFIFSLLLLPSLYVFLHIFLNIPLNIEPEYIEHINHIYEFLEILGTILYEILERKFRKKYKYGED
jgi:hypothetical protein